MEAAQASDAGGDPAWSARVLLVDPARVAFLVRYDPARPTLAEWRARYPQAIAIVNGSFYSVDAGEVRPTCEIVTAGKAVRGAGCHVKDALYFGARARSEPVLSAAMVSREPPPRPTLLSAQDYQPERWAEALKSFPALVRNGVPGCASTRYCTESSRTAAVAVTKDGRIAFFASQWPAVRREVGKWMAARLGAVDALNLDGGPEATMALRGEAPQESIGGHSVGLPLVVVMVPVASP